MLNEWIRGNPPAQYTSRFFLVTYSLFMLGFFLVPNAVDLYKFYSVLLFIPGLLIVPYGVAVLRENRLFYLLLLYFAYMLLTSVWGGPFEIKPFFNFLRLALYTLMFFIITAVVYKQYPNKFEWLLRILCLTASVAALISIVFWYQKHPFPLSRLMGLGILSHPNPNAFLYGFFAVFSFAYALQEKNWRWRATYLSGTFALLCFVWFTASRGGMTATLTGLGVLALTQNPKRALVYLASLAVLIAVLVGIFPEIVDSVIERGTANRLDIWKTVWSEIKTAPFFGHGYLLDQRVFVSSQNSYHSFAHNIYLATMRYGGVMGLVLLLALLVNACWQAAQLGKTRTDFRYLALLVFGMVCSFFDLDRLMVRPNEVWIILWFPMALIILTRHFQTAEVNRAAMQGVTTS